MPPLLCTNYKFFTVFHRLYSKTQQWFNSLFLSGYQGILGGLDVISIGVSHPEFLMFQPNMLEMMLPPEVFVMTTGPVP